ncbi:MAG: AAA family ATPase [Terracidiphilus sp.]
MNSDSSQYLDDQYPDSLGGDVLSIALIGPDEDRRKAAATALAGCQGGDIREFSTYPPSLDDVPRLLEQHYDVIIIDLDSHSEYALELVESICANGTATVMVYSMKADAELLVRCMRAGAREFLTMPFAQNTMAEALVRASARRPATRPAKKTGGKLMVFLGAKGGDGVTTLACNFAVAMAQESGQSTLLIDLDLPLGDAALNLGVVAEYSAINALQNAGRLDSSFLSKLLVKHSSGVSVLAAPGKFPQFQASNDAIDRLIAVARQDFDNVIIDMGSRLDLMGTSLFKDGSTVYLVIQAGIAGLRNSNRLISQYFNTGIPKLEIVINRFESRSMGVSEDQITKALTRPAQWKIPNDYAAVRRMQTTAIPLALEDSPISRLIHRMSRTACGLPATPEKKSGFSLKSFRSISGRSSAPDESQALTQLGLTSSRDHAASASSGEVQHEVQHDAPARLHSRPVPGPTPVAQPVEETYSPSRTEETARRADPVEEKRKEPQSISTPIRQGEEETRTYKGATYVKGPDGGWHLRESQSVVAPEAPSEPETRVYKGSTYVKVAGGEWRLLETSTEVKAQPAVKAHPAEKVRPVEIAQPVEVSPQTPSIAWPAPASIGYGTALSSAELNATASVPGRFEYSPATGDMLAAGVHTLSVSFTPADTKGFTTAQAAVPLTVTKATPTVAWPTPAPIDYGTPLSSAQLNATASVPGRFSYSPAAGAVLPSGLQTLSAVFTPTDSSDYSMAQATVSISVSKETPEATWPTPASIAYGTPLGDAQLNASASVRGSFSYTPAAGAVLPAGVQTLSATFNPEDTASYTTIQTSVTFIVTKATPSITWPTPASITYGTALSNAQLNATASVEGQFAYIPAVGAVLAAGTHTPSVIFTPSDTTNYTTAQAAVSLTVTKATPTITWPAPAPIGYGTAVSAAQLNAAASVPGKFTYTPSAGERLGVGTHTLSVAFTPNDTTDWAAVRATVSLTVSEAKPTSIAWPTPDAITYGSALSAVQLNATAPVPGRFDYTPADGEVLSTGVHTLSVIFTPDDINFPAVQAETSLTVTKAMPVIIWPVPAAISYGTALSDAQFNATASVSGSFVYSPSIGDVLASGAHTLSVTFTPDDTTDAATATASVSPRGYLLRYPAQRPPTRRQGIDPRSIRLYSGCWHRGCCRNSDTFGNLYPNGCRRLHYGAGLRVSSGRGSAEHSFAHAGGFRRGCGLGRGKRQRQPPAE